MKREANRVIFCDLCGHSHGGGLLYKSKTDLCRKTIMDVHIDDWRILIKAIPTFDPSRMTDLGWEALRPFPKKGNPS